MFLPVTGGLCCQADGDGGDPPGAVTPLFRAAVPVASMACRELRELVDRVVCAATPEPFYAVGSWYEDFSQTSGEQVRELCDRAARPQAG